MKKAIDAITGKRTYSENVNGGELVIEIRTRKTDMRRRGDLMRTWVQREAQRLEAVQAIHETEDAELECLGLTD